MAIEVKVGDRVRLVGAGWAGAYDGYRAGDIVEVVEIDEYGDIWANDVGTVGTNGTLFTDNRDGPYKGMYAVEALSIEVAYKGQRVEDRLREALTFDQKVRTVLDDMATLLVEKNTAYGNSALDPVRIFSKADTLEGLNQRIDDKLSRISRGRDYPGDDTIRDLIGYLTLLLIAREGEQ